MKLAQREDIFVGNTDVGICWVFANQISEFTLSKLPAEDQVGPLVSQHLDKIDFK